MTDRKANAINNKLRVKQRLDSYTTAEIVQELKIMTDYLLEHLHDECDDCQACYPGKCTHHA